MMPVSGVNTGAAQPLAAVERILKASRGQKPEEAQTRPPKPVMDEYVREKPQEPSGRYQMGKDEDGSGKKAANGKKEEICRGSTEAVDNEIKKLKKKKEELKHQLDSETDDTKIKELEKKLAQIEGELRQKDSDAYRRQHSVFF